MMFRTLDLFSGIGGFSLGLERAGGFKTVAFCEIEPFCRRVLKKHWPDVPIYPDVRELTAERLAADGIAVDVICGGFPCQDLSIARGASRTGLDGERSGLWSEYARLIGEIRPSFVIVENVPGLLGLGLGRVLGDLATIGFDAEWHCISAAAVGAPHIRDRFWMVGYPDDESQSTVTINDEAPRVPSLVADAGDSGRRVVLQHVGEPGSNAATDTRRDGKISTLANASRPRLSLAWSQQVGAHGQHSGRVLAASGWWATEPDVGRVAHGVPSRVHRLRALGNAVVPQIPELIGRAILASEQQRSA